MLFLENWGLRNDSEPIRNYFCNITSLYDAWPALCLRVSECIQVPAPPTQCNWCYRNLLRNYTALHSNYALVLVKKSVRPRAPSVPWLKFLRFVCFNYKNTCNSYNWKIKCWPVRKFFHKCWKGLQFVIYREVKWSIFSKILFAFLSAQYLSYWYANYTA